MQPGDLLSKQYSVGDYVRATSTRDDRYDVKGFVFVETDARVDDSKADVRGWAEEPLKEIAFLRRIVEGDISRKEGFNPKHSSLLRGIIAWAPLDRPLHDFLQYMAVAKEVAGQETWNRIKGFRYLVQGITDECKFRSLVNGGSDSSFIMILKFLGSRGLVFDVGVDQRQGGVWQLEHFAEAIEHTHADVASKDKTIFILSKPSTPTSH
jgi:L-rhamnono-1,4-lactonase